MNLNPQDNPTPGIDEALLNEALAEEMPVDLEAKILALTDPQMLALLDEAMAPEANDQLTQRILSATQQHMKPGTVPVQQTEQHVGVLARIGPMTFRYAAAAVIALAVGLGVYFVNQGPEDTSTTLAKTDDTPGNAVDDTNENNLPDWLSDEQFASNEGYFVNATSPLEDALEEAADSLEGVSISRDTLWAELDAYEQFLDDFES